MVSVGDAGRSTVLARLLEVWGGRLPAGRFKGVRGGGGPFWRGQGLIEEAIGKSCGVWQKTQPTPTSMLVGLGLGFRPSD